MTYDEFIKKFEPLTYKKTGEVRVFETFGKDLEYVNDHLNQYIWTEVDSDTNADRIIIPGKHEVNRISYLICKKFWTTEDEAIEVNLD